MQVKSTFDQIHAALQQLYAHRLVETGNPLNFSDKLVGHAEYKMQYDTITNNLAEKGCRTLLKSDPQDNTAEDVLSSDDLAKLADVVLGSADRTSTRDLCWMLWAFSTLTRSDDARLTNIADLQSPTEILCIGRVYVHVGVTGW